jgi:glucosamine kinase
MDPVMDQVMDLVIGVDAGGTTTRCVLADLAGRHVGEGRSGGLNQHSSGGEAPNRLTEAVSQALGRTSPARVRGGVIAVAGAGEAGHAAVQRDVERTWRTLGLGGRPDVVPDVLAAFAAGTDHDAGQVLVSGTGAIAAAVGDAAVVARADGYGWLLGDIGSAVWLGREAVTSALAALDGRGPRTHLTDDVLTALEATTAQDVVRVVYAAAPAQLGHLAPVVTDRAARGDEAAADIVGRGVAGLLASFDAVCRDRTAPTVLAGALLTAAGPVAEQVRAGLAERGVADVHTAPDPVSGAVRLALRRATETGAATPLR